MAIKNPYSPLVIPHDWQGTMRNFGTQLAGIVTDIYLKLTKQKEKAESTDSQIKALDDKFSPITFGSTSSDISTVLSSNWTTDVPNDGVPHLAKVNAQYGSCYGYLSRYDDSYGSGVLTRYDGSVYNVFLNNGTVTIKIPVQNDRV